jgi:hypothetical protein
MFGNTCANHDFDFHLYLMFSEKRVAHCNVDGVAFGGSRISVLELFKI